MIADLTQPRASLLDRLKLGQLLKDQELKSLSDYFYNIGVVRKTTIESDMRLIDGSEVSEFICDVADHRCILHTAATTKNIFFEVFFFPQKEYFQLVHVFDKNIIRHGELLELTTSVVEYSVF